MTYNMNMDNLKIAFDIGVKLAYKEKLGAPTSLLENEGIINALRNLVGKGAKRRAGIRLPKKPSERYFLQNPSHTEALEKGPFGLPQQRQVVVDDINRIARPAYSPVEPGIKEVPGGSRVTAPEGWSLGSPASPAPGIPAGEGRSWIPGLGNKFEVAAHKEPALVTSKASPDIPALSSMLENWSR